MARSRGQPDLDPGRHYVVGGSPFPPRPPSGRSQSAPGGAVADLVIDRCRYDVSSCHVTGVHFGDDCLGIRWTFFSAVRGHLINGERLRVEGGSQKIRLKTGELRTKSGFWRETMRGVRQFALVSVLCFCVVFLRCVFAFLICALVLSDHELKDKTVPVW